ncbi:MAG: GAF domain-containing sensor histidine kinase [Actinomycetota bacterium]
MNGAVAAVLGLVAGVILAWPAMLAVALLGAGFAADATLALRSDRRKATPTIIADVVFVNFAMLIAGVPGPAVGVVVAYFVLVVTVLGDSRKAWIAGFLAVALGAGAMFVSYALGLHDQPLERSIVAGVVTVSVFGLATFGIALEFARVTRRVDRSSGRRIEVADAISAASRALVAQDDIGAMARALDTIREALHTAVVFIERNHDDPSVGLVSVVEERSIDPLHLHPSFDRSATMPWSVMPRARSHLEGGAPFFYRVEEARGTSYDRGGDSGIQVEVDVPIIVHGEWMGVVGAADSDADRVWRSDDLILLRTLADLTSALWERTEGSRVRESLIGRLDGRLRYEKALARSSRSLLGEQSTGLAPALEAIGLAMGVDEVCVAETISDEAGEPAARVAATWTLPGITPISAVEEVVAYSEMPDIREAMHHDEVAFWSEGETRRMIIGITVGGAWYGTVSFIRQRGPRTWSDRDVSFGRTIADILGAFFERSANRARLEHSLSSKDQLIASVSHELRTPLTAVVGLAEELITAGDDLDAGERSELIEIIAESSRDLANLVEDLLVAARSEEGTLPVFPDRIDLSTLAQSVLSHLIVPENHSVVIEDNTCVAYGDPIRVRQIIRNLLTNAFRYGVSPITVTVRTEDGRALLDVHDTGAGIPVSDRQAIFEPYGRAESSPTSKASVGLGLALSRRLAGLMGGSLTYEDGDGATFRLTLPVSDEDG